MSDCKDAKALKDSDPLLAEARVESYASTLTLYTRAGCPLCEEMAEQVRARAGAHRMIAVDVDGDPALQARFGWDVPLLFEGEAEICRHEFDAVAFGAWLERV
ncbi:MAG: glutaredoxin family protein [Thiobacillus sp.]|nr:glutaredoxin family protein [Thiobacillus sp.]